MPDLDAQVDYIEDDVLRLIFLSCHPFPHPRSRAALTLRLVGGLTTSEIARGFLVTEPPWASGSRAPRRRSRRPGRSSSSHGSDRMDARRRDGGDLPDLQRGLLRHRGRGLDVPRADERGMRLAGCSAELTPDEPEVHGLQALWRSKPPESRQARRRRRTVLLEAQDRLHLGRGAHPTAACPPRSSAEARRTRQAGRKVLPPGAIASRHARADRAEDTDWRASRPVRRAGRGRPGAGRRGDRAVAHGRAFDPAPDSPSWTNWAQPRSPFAVVPSVLRRPPRTHRNARCSGRRSFLEAATRTRNDRERDLLQRRAGRTWIGCRSLSSASAGR